MGCRVAAILMAIAAVIDPTVRSLRTPRPVISVVATNAWRDSTEISRVVGQLDNTFSVVRGAFPSAAGTVIVGNVLPPWADLLASPVVAVAPTSRPREVTIRRIEAPAVATTDARVTIAATIATHRQSPAKEGRPDSVVVELVHDQVVVSRHVAPVHTDSVYSVPLHVVPVQAAPMVLRLQAYPVGAPDTTQSDLMVDVRSTKHSVLFFDRRPSWMSTFVRRALERDPRFVVSSRVITSSNVSRETGNTPPGLDEVARASQYDVVVIGAPDALTRADVNGVQTLLASRGAGVVVLPDHAAVGLLGNLLGFEKWNTPVLRTPVDIVPTPGSLAAHDSLRLRGMAIGVPATLPAGAEAIASIGTTPQQVVVWRLPVGHGTLAVSGAFDAWRYRDATQSTFDAAWRDIINDVANRRQKAMDVRVAPALVTPGTPVHLTVHVRDPLARAGDALLVSVQPRAFDTASPPSAPLADTSEKTVIVTHAGVTSDQHVAVWRAPVQPGVYDVQVSYDGDTVQTAVVVADHVAHDSEDDPAFMSAWTASRGGRFLVGAERDSLVEVLRRTVTATPQLVSWHPMRSPWMIVPFSLLLSCEWWTRRRRGQR
jgi:hypothetical protein